MINKNSLNTAFNYCFFQEPFPHVIIDDFLKEDFAYSIAEEFPQFDSNLYNGHYENQIEFKNTCNIWDRFLPCTYQLIYYLNSEDFIENLSLGFNDSKLRSDPGLHGGGLHCYPRGGRLNPHQDYLIHPKLNLIRKYNLLIYLTPGWQESWGGHLGLWSCDINDNPKDVEVKILPRFNRAVIFDTTMKSWHGLCEDIVCPHGITRNSIAVYYLADEEKKIDQRKRALFYPTPEQQDDKEILDLIKRRSIINSNDVTSWIRK